MVPLQLYRTLQQVASLLPDVEHWPEAAALLRNQRFDKKPMKVTFNAYSDRVSTGQAGQEGASPSGLQTMRYLTRNDIISNVDSLRFELDYLIREREKGEAGDADTADLSKYMRAVLSGFEAYFKLLPREDVAAAVGS
ncbi:hypothetical protein JKP88DRAFT_199093 [Tribonema minus]|uniref:Uncharacterized protein n=1 Tax=Tribonema minus TaxID=303371 RepID=A0A836CEE2_9STRA|nr:hypothetical protein JKP88DRAFT_199093 [Tribonema minus]